MIEIVLRKRLEPIEWEQRRSQLWRDWMRCWSVAAALALALVLIRFLAGWSAAWLLPFLAAGTAFATWFFWRRNQRAVPDYRVMARRIEKENPELHALLLTAVEQQPDPATGRLNFLQERVIAEALAQDRARWRAGACKRATVMRFGAVAALAGLIVLLPLLYQPVAPGTSFWTFISVPGSVEVTPGDTIIERGSSLVVLARFDRDVPSEATLVLSLRNQPERRIPLARNLADPVFGTSVPGIIDELTYRIEYGDQATPEFTVSVFEHPRLERTDATISFPDYTGLSPQTINDTRRVSAVEGSRLDYVFHLNKPVRSATLKPREGDAIALKPAPDRPGIYAAEFTLEQGGRYELLLVDEEGRTNRFPPQFVIEVSRNQPPELRFTFPRGDQRVSALQEILFEGEVSDDFGLKAFGIAYNLAGHETRVVELGRGAGPHEKQRFTHLLPLEELDAQPDQLLSYYLWAEDVGPDGQVRRAMSDMFFAEVRPFEEIFREGQSAADGDEARRQQQQEGGGGDAAERLAELQKQIISATWNIQRRETGSRPSAEYEADVALVQESQEEALQQARSQRARTDDPESQGLLSLVEQEMEKAAAHLREAADSNSIEPLPSALAAEQSAYQALLRLASREFMVARGGQQRGRGGQGGRAQRQLDQLQLRQSENRYATQSQALPQNEEQREQLRTFNRLQELAQRQQDVNERLRELQAALREARTQEEREEIQRQLRRLREEQQDLLADVDELRQRMERPENQSRMAEARQQLDRTRSDVQRAAEALEQGSVPDALSSATRAQRDLQELRDEFRRESSSRFADEMRDLRDRARDLTRQQEEIGRELEALNAPGGRALTDRSEREDLAERLLGQRDRLNEMVERAAEVTREAEPIEPLLARQLYDALRQAAQDDPRNLQETTDDLLGQGRLYQRVYDRLREGRRESRRAVEVAADLLREGFSTEASELEERARNSMNELRRGVERAAESVLGDETEALRLARRELDHLRDDLEREIDQFAGGRGVAGEEESREGARGGAEGRQLASGGVDTDEEQDRLRTEAGRGGQGGEDQERDGSERGQELAQGGGQEAEDGSLRPGGAPQNGAEGSRERSGGGGTGTFLDQFTGPAGGGGPITGPEYSQWVDRLRDVEEMLDIPELRAEAARIRDRARMVRSDVQRHSKDPQWELIRLEIATPLAELRTRISEELARRESTDALVPIDRDPVPSRFSELVRRYYEQLSGEQAQ